MSDSVEDILGYLPHEVKGKSCWEYFHPDEIPFARAVHGRGIQLDKAAVLNYCQIKHKDGSWIGCECVFTVVYDVLVGCTSIYRRGPRSKRKNFGEQCLFFTDSVAERAFDAPAIRRIFSSSPRDPRYHMLSYISNKFYRDQAPASHEPRAALFLNRFTRTSTIMFATTGISNILGITAEQLMGKSFYFCIAENCLSDAVRCLESAKANDSIAYLRFWFRNPLQENHSRDASTGHSSDEDEDDGGVRIIRSEVRSPVSPDAAIESSVSSHSNFLGDQSPSRLRIVDSEENARSRGSSGNSTDLSARPDEVFDRPALQRERSSASSIEDPLLHFERIEVEACVSCTSDGLVVILRRARPLVPQALGSTQPPADYENGVFAAPWALKPFESEHDTALAGSVPEAVGAPGTEPEPSPIMSAIRDIASFAWSLTGINGSIADLAHGRPTGESQPPGGLPIWDASANADPDNIYNGFSGSAHRPINLAQVDRLDSVDGVDEAGKPIGSPIKEDERVEKTIEESSSEDEIVWKRAPTMPEWRRPPRRAHRDAFGSEDEGDGKEADERASQSRRRRLDG